LESLNRAGNYLFFVVWGGMLLHIAAVNARKSDWFNVLWCAVIAGFPVYGLIRSVARGRSMREFAAEHRLEFFGESLPNGLLIDRTSFALRNYSVANCVRGKIDSREFAAFDVRYSLGKGTRIQTVIGIPRNQQISEAPVDRVGSYEFEGAGDWIIGYIPGRTVAVRELRDWCIEMEALACQLLAEDRGSAESGPRLFRWMT
jgi:hypothetical protein